MNKFWCEFRKDWDLVIILVIACTIAATCAQAGTVTVTWTPPATCADGSPTTNCVRTGYKLYGALSGQPKVLISTYLASDSTGTLANVAPGNWCYDMTTLAGSGESVHSAESCKVVPSPLPNPPTIVTVATTAYNVIKGTNKLTLVAVGTVPLATACDSTQYVNGYNVVPRAKVTWTGTVKPVVVVAKCG